MCCNFQLTEFNIKFSRKAHGEKKNVKTLKFRIKGIVHTNNQKH